MRRPWEDAGDQGFATVWAAMATASLCVIFAALLAMGQGVAARHRAGGAADLAALAAADQSHRGRDAACAVAAKVADAQGARVVRCAVIGDIADVTAQAAFGPYRPKVRARAGPPVPGVPADSVRRRDPGGLKVSKDSGNPQSAVLRPESSRMRPVRPPERA